MPKTIMTRLSLVIPEELLELYDDEARSKSTTIEDAIIDRLYRCRKHNDRRGLYLNDEERSEFERLVGGRVLKDGQQAIQRLRNAMSLKIDNVQITLEANLLSRLKSRCFGPSFKDFIKEEAIKGLERFAMLR